MLARIANVKTDPEELMGRGKSSGLVDTSAKATSQGRLSQAANRPDRRRVGDGVDAMCERHFRENF